MDPEGLVRAEEWRPLASGLERGLETPSRKNMNFLLKSGMFW